MNSVVEEVRLSLPHIELAAHLFGPEDGLPVIALHGWLDNANSFARLAPKLKGLRIIALDMAGHGHSGHRPNGAGYALWDYAHDVLQVAEQLGWKRFALLGHSLGAIVSLVLTGSLPERVTHLALIDGVIPPTDKGENAAERMGMALQAQLDLREKTQAGLQHPRPRHRSTNERLGGGQSRSRRTAGPARLDAGARRLYLAHRQPPDPAIAATSDHGTGYGLRPARRLSRTPGGCS
ncbi:pimeloyl-ACP methyl ester carboxylesterase [Pseudomonas sp. YL-218 TE3947]|uniref:alpha/beta fold hydrolase n=1 Tax=Pseudomonas sp. YL-218 TE3947 TaxID=3349324 RepID=UPI003D19D980